MEERRRRSQSIWHQKTRTIEVKIQMKSFVFVDRNEKNGITFSFFFHAHKPTRCPKSSYSVASSSSFSEILLRLDEHFVLLFRWLWRLQPLCKSVKNRNADDSNLSGEKRMKGNKPETTYVNEYENCREAKKRKMQKIRIRDKQKVL